MSGAKLDKETAMHNMTMSNPLNIPSPCGVEVSQEHYGE